MIGDLVNNGLVVLGESDQTLSGGVATTLTGNYTLAGTGTLRARLSDSGAGGMTVSGIARLAGTLQIVLLPGASPGFGRMLGYGSRQGTFGGLSGPADLEIWYDDSMPNSAGVRPAGGGPAN